MTVPRSARTRALAAIVLAALLAADTAQAQGWNYPAFQLPVTTRRELNFGIADGGDVLGGTSVVFLAYRPGFARRSRASPWAKRAGSW